MTIGIVALTPRADASGCRNLGVMVGTCSEPAVIERLIAPSAEFGVRMRVAGYTSAA